MKLKDIMEVGLTFAALSYYAHCLKTETFAIPTPHAGRKIVKHDR
jgi:hypothetical protein